MQVTGWRSSYFGNNSRVPSQRHIVTVFWTHQGNVITMVYNKNGELKEIQDNGELR